MNRARNILDNVFRTLGPRYKADGTGGRAGRPVFNIAENAPPGTRFKDGKKIHLHMGPTVAQFHRLLAISDNDTEVARAIIGFVVHRDADLVNKIVLQNTAPSHSQVEEMVERKVAEQVADILGKLGISKTVQESAIDQTSEGVSEAEILEVAPDAKLDKPVNEEVAKPHFDLSYDEADILKKAKALGMEVKRKKDGTLNRLSVLNVQRKWVKAERESGQELSE